MAAQQLRAQVADTLRHSLQILLKAFSEQGVVRADMPISPHVEEVAKSGRFDHAE